MSHTPGPWEAYAPTHVGTCGENAKTICHASVEVDGDTTANMRLIAAAPDLLEALERAIPEIAVVGISDLLEQAREAIKKARGE